MMRCPFCDADLSAGSFRLRGGRCPQCGSILSWAQEENAEEAAEQSPSPPPPPAPPSAPVDEDAMSMKDIVRTLVSRGGGDDDAAEPPASTPPRASSLLQ